MSQPFEPSTGELDLKALDGCGVICHVGGVYPDMQTRHGPKAVLQTNLTVITGPHAGAEIMDKRIFNSRVVRGLRGDVGRSVLGHIALDYSTSNPTVLWQKPNQVEQDAAEKWVANNPGRCEEMLAIAISAFAAQQAEQPKRNAAFTPQPRGEERPSDPPSFTQTSTEDDGEAPF